MLHLLATPAIFLLVLAGFCLLGSFMTLYNYLGFRLQEPPFNLSPGLAGLVFLTYPLGSLGSAWLGALASKWGRGPVLVACSLMMLTGLAMMTPDSLPMIVVGLSLLTFSFFGAHAICAGWAPAAASADKAQASSLYLLLYYIGGGVAGSVGGVFWASHRWDGVALFSAIIMAGVLAVAIALSRTSQAR
jgi:YNFM family putative membrane transporter